MSIRNKILRRVGIQPEAELVERASRRERWRRQAWMFASTLIVWSTVIAGMWVLAQVTPWFPPTGIIGIATAIGAMIVAGVLDIKLFGWGVDQFDLVKPWQFRDEKARE